MIERLRTSLDAWVGLRGSTLPVSLARVLMALTLWSEHGPTERLFEVLDPGKALFAVAFWVLTTAMLLGWRARWSTGATGVLLLIGWLAFGEFGPDDHFRRHHTYYAAVITLLLAFTPCGDAFSVDRWQASRADRVLPVTGDLWAIRLIQLQTSALYLYGAWDKTYLTFPERMESYYAYLYFGAQHPGPAFSAAMVVAGYGAVLLEYSLAVAFLFRRTIPLAVAVAVGFHFLIYWTLTVGTFTVLMYVVFLVLLDPDRVGRALTEAGVGPAR